MRTAVVCETTPMPGPRLTNTIESTKGAVDPTYPQAWPTADRRFWRGDWGRPCGSPDTAPVRGLLSTHAADSGHPGPSPDDIASQHIEIVVAMQHRYAGTDRDGSDQAVDQPPYCLVFTAAATATNRSPFQATAWKFS